MLIKVINPVILAKIVYDSNTCKGKRGGRDMQYIAYEEIEFKDRRLADRMLRSESARRRRKETKNVRETRTLNKFAKARRMRKAKR